MLNLEINEEHMTSRDILIELLTSELPVLRARLGISQDEISKRVGISRQTYSLVEGKKQKMSWVTFMALVSFFEHNPPTKDLLTKIGFFKNTAFNKCLIYK